MTWTVSEHTFALQSTKIATSERSEKSSGFEKLLICYCFTNIPSTFLNFARKTVHFGALDVISSKTRNFTFELDNRRIFLSRVLISSILNFSSGSYNVFKKPFTRDSSLIYVWLSTLTMPFWFLNTGGLLIKI